ncbi:UDP-3-O-acyl-N-acetylglucosamine deacetylase [Thermodesulfovibrionales bacterium]|nr:UDP-3-O-acyl-N-acetylglucosamine deacetylase [Thermodesulfovibrionales bacterium]MCL0040599.1 UDP-3-O-acyl-N-acetylglucosamine deacetylase [Thermodesulfovibrionales bacterium]MCL0066675.1 UDP-3-O-acyl-N-acetylglucosamine deacetylase [Thermodesulfovibrionales bacterium]MCL0096268.1 UDP-3-O-acyl-N-acetylglucosamine deacetylase [Thermodesulfovibrionales bacterium]
MRLQQTIKKEVLFQGVGLHAGRHATVKLKSAPVDTGIVFYRRGSGTIMRANISSVIDTGFATTIGVNGTRIKTVEHLLAAIAGLGIDNLIIEVDGLEIPILDGSSTKLVKLILAAGITKQMKRIPFIKIVKPIVYEDGYSRVVALPYNGTRISYYINFEHQLLGQQELILDINAETFIEEIAPARTFGFLSDVKKLRTNGFVKGGSLDNVVIIGGNSVLNATGLRFKDEFVRHKMLDSIGDLSLIGFPIEGHIIMERSGHTTNINFLRKLVSSIDCYTLVSEVDYLSYRVLN